MTKEFGGTLVPQQKTLLINFLLMILKKESLSKMLFIINGSFKLIKNELLMILI